MLVIEGRYRGQAGRIYSIMPGSNSFTGHPYVWVEMDADTPLMVDFKPESLVKYNALTHVRIRHGLS